MPEAPAGPVSGSDPATDGLRGQSFAASSGLTTDAPAGQVGEPDVDRLARELPGGPEAIDGAFHARELELNVTEEEYKRYSPPAACLDPDTILRRISGGTENCPALKPGPDEEEVFSLPFLAICGWVVVVLGVAGLYRFWGVWRLRRWVHRMRVLGLMPNAPSPRRTAGRRSRRSSSRGKPRTRRYAG